LSALSASFAMVAMLSASAGFPGVPPQEFGSPSPANTRTTLCCGFASWCAVVAKRAPFSAPYMGVLPPFGSSMSIEFVMAFVLPGSSATGTTRSS
jgi:hypothetical protein